MTIGAIFLIVSAFAFWLMIACRLLVWGLNSKTYALDLYRLSHWFYGAAQAKEAAIEAWAAHVEANKQRMADTRRRLEMPGLVEEG